MYYNLPSIHDSEVEPQNPTFMNNPENVHPWFIHIKDCDKQVLVTKEHRSFRIS